MSTVFDDFIARARDVTIEAAAARLKLVFRRKTAEHAQPCPACGGDDRFSFNVAKQAWVCRGSAGGRDAIGMAAHVLGYDLEQRDGFFESCAAVLGEPIPAEGERESDDDRLAREAKLAAAREKSDQKAARRDADQVDFRERERRKARGIHAAALPLGNARIAAGRAYLSRRCRDYPEGPGAWLRVAADLTYWHGADDRGEPAALHCGPAMVAPFLAPRDGVSVANEPEIVGCHITWIDLARPPKFRPALFGLTRNGVAAGRPEWRAGDAPPSDGDLSAGHYERLPTKKMRGTKKGGVIPIAGDLAAARWVGGEGIENGVAFGAMEGFRDDTFYFAAGDLGNLSGPADPASRFAHPALTSVDRAGRTRPVMVQGPLPRPDQTASDAMPVPDHVGELVLLSDGDSERVMTAAAMARARALHRRPGRRIFVLWPKSGLDFSDLTRLLEPGPD